MKGWLTDRRFWMGTGKWFAGLLCGIIFVVGAARVFDCFADDPWAWLSIMTTVAVVALVLGAVRMLQYGQPMTDGEIEKRTTPSWPDTTLSCSERESNDYTRD